LHPGDCGGNISVINVVNRKLLADCRNKSYLANSSVLTWGEFYLPHVVLNGKINIEDVFRELKPLFLKDEHVLLRTADSYLEREKRSILIESLSIQGTKTTSFLTMISSREDGIVIRLYPKSEVEKTDGVKRLLAELAKQLLQKFVGLRLGETNLSKYLS
jgi:hypothetical protein